MMGIDGRLKIAQLGLNPYQIGLILKMVMKMQKNEIEPASKSINLKEIIILK